MQKKQKNSEKYNQIDMTKITYTSTFSLLLKRDFFFGFSKFVLENQNYFLPLTQGTGIHYLKS